jgi:hypothetical protein
MFTKLPGHIFHHDFSVETVSLLNNDIIHFRDTFHPNDKRDKRVCVCVCSIYSNTREVTMNL